MTERTPQQIRDRTQLSQTFAAAAALHRKGDLAGAAAGYEAVLQAEPAHFDALRLLAVLHLQTGDAARSAELSRGALAVNPRSAITHHNLASAQAALHAWADALQSYDRSIALDPGLAQAHAGRGVALSNLGQSEAALASYDRAITLRPDDADSHRNRAAALRDLKRPGEAVAGYETAIALRPGDPLAHNNLGNALTDLDRPLDALAAFDRALALKPDLAIAHNGRGKALLALDRPGPALESLDAALAQQPDYAIAWYNRGVALLALKRPDDALASFDRAIALQPGYVEALNNRGVTLVELQRFEAALHSYDAAVALRPDDAGLLNNRGEALLRAGRPEAALADWDAAIALAPDAPDPHFNRSMRLLTAGRFEDGWREYAYRWRVPTFLQGSAQEVPPQIRARLGQDLAVADLAGRHVLAVGEQGVGDILMFASILPDLQATAARVSLACEARLKRLLGHSFPQIDVLGPLDAAVDVSAFEAIIALGDLGQLYRRTAADFPGTPYLSPRPQVRERWLARLEPKATRLRVGLSWRGGIARTGRDARSIPLAQLGPLLAQPHCEFVSLQYGDHAGELSAVNAGLERPIRVFPADEMEDFEDLAGLVQALDVVVSVQTTLVHLCGGLGAPCLTMLPHLPEWRYATASAAMPWYGSVTLFRQDEDRAWGPVLDRVMRHPALN